MVEDEKFFLERLLECLKDARSKLSDQDEIDLAYIDEVIAKAEGRS